MVPVIFTCIGIFVLANTNSPPSFLLLAPLTRYAVVAQVNPSIVVAVTPPAGGFSTAQPEHNQSFARPSSNLNKKQLRDSARRSVLQQQAHLLLTVEQEQELRNVFEDHDPDGSGTIDVESLGLIAHDLGEPLTDEELSFIRRDLDHENTGVISFDRFIKWWNRDGYFS